jgi:hypothetical protein
MEESTLNSLLTSTLSSHEVDEDLLAYLTGMLTEMSLEDLKDDEGLKEVVGPFLEGAEVPDDVIDSVVSAVVAAAEGGDGKGPPGGGVGDGLRKLAGGVVMGDSKTSAADEATNSYLWGTDTYAAKFNAQKDVQVAESSKDRRKAKQELERARKEYEAKVRGEC